MIISYWKNAIKLITSRDTFSKKKTQSSSGKPMRSQIFRCEWTISPIPYLEKANNYLGLSKLFSNHGDDNAICSIL